MGDTTDSAAEQVLLTREINVAHITDSLPPHTAGPRPVKFDRRASLWNDYFLN